MTLPDWDFVKLEELIESRGDLVIVETGVSCTCRREDSLASTVNTDGNPATVRRLNCPTCHGTGSIYRNARVIKGLVTSIQSGPHRDLLEGGFAVSGDAVFSPSLNAGLLSDLDKVTFTTSSTISEGQVILRGAASINENSSLFLGLADNEDRLWYIADASLWCEDENGVVYSQGTDYIFRDRTIQWIGNKPSKGTFYTLKYTAFLEWIVYNTPLLRIDTSRSLAQRVLLRKKHVAFNHSSPQDTPTGRTEEQDRLVTRVSI